MIEGDTELPCVGAFAGDKAVASGCVIRHVPSRFHFLGWMVSLVLGLSSCATPGVRELTRPITESGLAMALVSNDQLSGELRAYLENEGVYELYRRSPAEAVQTLAKRLSELPSDGSRASLAEVCSKAGDRLRGKNPDQALGFYLEAARLSVDSAVATARQAEETPMRIVYNHSSPAFSSTRAPWLKR